MTRPDKEEQDKINDRHLQHWRNIQVVINSKLAEYQEKDANGKPTFTKLPPKELKNIVNSMKEAIIGERMILGLPIHIAKTEQEITLPDETSYFEDEEINQIIQTSVESSVESSEE